MIIDAVADFRSLLMHHVTAHWPDAVISAYDPTSAGHLPDEFSGAGNDIVLLGNEQGDRDGLDVLRRLARVPHLPPVIYFGTRSERLGAEKIGVAAFLERARIRHDALVVRMTDAVVARERLASTGSLFVGDVRTGINPLIKGYRLISKLSSTAHSAVYLAEHESTRRRVALKVLRHVPDVSDVTGAFDRFLQ